MTKPTKKVSKQKRMQSRMKDDRDDRMELTGTVEEALAGTLFKIICETHTVIATLSGKLRQNQIRILPGDQVMIEVSPYDTTRGRIMKRL